MNPQEQLEPDFVVKHPLQWELKRQPFYRELTERFDLSEIKHLCADLDLKYEELKGETLSEKAIALFDYFERSSSLHDLFRACQNVRPNTDWWQFMQPVSPETSKSFASLPSQTVIQNWWIFGGILTIAVVLGVILGWFFAGGRDDHTLLTIPSPVNVMARFDFEKISGEPLTGWGLSTCSSLDTSQCGWINADEKLSLGKSGFSGENSLQVEATLHNSEQIYTTERCFDPTLLDGISASVYLPVRENDQEALAAMKIYMLARPAGDENLSKQWPTSILELGESAQAGWYQITLDLSQVANEGREPYNTLLVDCVHIDFILPATTPNEQATFLIDDVALFRDISSHNLDTNIPPSGLTAELTNVLAPTGEGILIGFEDGLTDTAIFSAGNDDPTYNHNEDDELSISHEQAYDGAFSMAFSPHLKKFTSDGEGNSFCIELNGENLVLQNRIVISRLFIPADAPDNLGIQYHLSDQWHWPSWAGNSLKRGQWNTLVWFTADSPAEWRDDSNLLICLYLDSSGEDSEYPDDGSERTFFIDSIELIPYRFTHQDTKALKPVSFYHFADGGADLPSSLSLLPNQYDNYDVSKSINNDDIRALQIDLDLSPHQGAAPSRDINAGLLLDTGGESVEAVLALVQVPGDSGNTLSLTFEGSLSTGEIISQEYSLIAGEWTPIFWPVRGNNFDDFTYKASVDEIAIFITSDEPYQGAILFDYLTIYQYNKE